MRRTKRRDQSIMHGFRGWSVLLLNHVCSHILYIRVFSLRDNVEWGAEQEAEAREKVRENSADLMDPDKAGQLFNTGVCSCSMQYS